MTMNADEALERVLKALKTELRSTHNIGSIERRVGRSRGYFSKVSARKWRISLDVLLCTLEVLEIDPATFFANAFAPPRPPGTRKSGELTAAQRRFTKGSAPRLPIGATGIGHRQPTAGGGRRW